MSIEFQRTTRRYIPEDKVYKSVTINDDLTHACFHYKIIAIKNTIFMGIAPLIKGNVKKKRTYEIDCIHCINEAIYAQEIMMSTILVKWFLPMLSNELKKAQTSFYIGHMRRDTSQWVFKSYLTCFYSFPSRV
jgi:hypothetical protein